MEVRSIIPARSLTFLAFTHRESSSCSQGGGLHMFARMPLLAESTGLAFCICSGRQGPPCESCDDGEGQERCDVRCACASGGEDGARRLAGDIGGIRAHNHPGEEACSEWHRSVCQLQLFVRNLWREC